MTNDTETVIPSFTGTITLTGGTQVSVSTTTDARMTLTCMQVRDGRAVAVETTLSIDDAQTLSGLIDSANAVAYRIDRINHRAS